MSTALPSAPPRRKSSRILELDAIRALSCLNLLLFHFTYVYECKYGFTSDPGFTFPYGKYGVQLFFMLSGLVNAMTLLSKRQPGDFLAARCIRIFPSYWLVILTNLILFASLPLYQHTISWDETLANLTSMPVLLGYDNMEPVTWTLQIEMLFYVVLMTLFATGLLDRPLRTMMACMLGCLVLGTGLTYAQQMYPDSHWQGPLFVLEELLIVRYLPLFSMGILLNELRCQRGNPYALWAGIGVSALVFHAIDLRDHNPLATVLMFGLLTASAYGRVPLLRWKPLIYISFISYSLYLFHNNLGSLVIHQLEQLGLPPLVTIGLATAFAIGVAHAVTYWLEQPITNWLRRHYAAAKKRYTQPPPADSVAVSLLSWFRWGRRGKPHDG